MTPYSDAERAMAVRAVASALCVAPSGGAGAAAACNALLALQESGDCAWIEGLARAVSRAAPAGAPPAAAMHRAAAARALANLAIIAASDVPGVDEELASAAVAPLLAAVAAGLTVVGGATAEEERVRMLLEQATATLVFAQNELRRVVVRSVAAEHLLEPLTPLRRYGGATLGPAAEAICSALTAST
jgi:hypothetical protein